MKAAKTGSGTMNFRLLHFRTQFPRLSKYLFKKLNLRPSKQEFLTITETTQQGDRADPNYSKKESADERRLE